MKLEDVGLNPEMPYFRPKVNKGRPKITYLHLHECEKFSVCNWLWFLSIIRFKDLVSVDSYI